MSKQVGGLTNEIIESVTPDDKALKLFDGGGLYLLVTTTGSKLWRLKYRWEGKEKVLALGAYPGVSIDSVRMMRNDAKNLLKNGLDPSAERKMGKLSEAQAARSTINTAVRVSNDGVLEIWKGRIAIRLTSDEAAFIKNQLCKLIE